MWERRYRLGSTLDRWGPSAWNVLHAFAHRLPEQLSDDARDRFALFLQLFAEHLPCPRCREHFLQYLKETKTPLSFTSRAAAVRFLHDAHNAVSERLGKRPVSFAEHLRVYGPQPVRDHKGCCRLLMCAVVVAVCAVLRTRRRKSETP